MKDINVTSLDKRIINIIDQLPRNGNFSQRKISQITGISVHHSASPQGKFTAKDYANWEMNGSMKAPAICYHFVIPMSGGIQQTNLLTARSWHSGNANTSTIGICLDGNFETEQPTDEQIRDLNWLTNYMKQVLNRDLIIKGHREWKGNATACPGKNLVSKQSIWKF